METCIAIGTTVNTDPWFHRMEIVPGSARVSETDQGWCIHFEIRQRCDPCECELCWPPIRPIKLSPDDLAFLEARDHAGTGAVPSAGAADDEQPASGV